MDWRFKAYRGIDPHFHEDSDSYVQTVNSEQYLGLISIQFVTPLAQRANDVKNFCCQQDVATHYPNVHVIVGNHSILNRENVWSSCYRHLSTLQFIS